LTLSIGGWTWSQKYSLAVRNSKGRESLAQSIVELFSEWECFRGVSIDWEYISDNGVNYGNQGNEVHPSDPENLALFIQLLRKKFVQRGWRDYTIAMCFTPAPEKIHFPVQRFIPLLDEWHIMTYESVHTPANILTFA